MCVQWVQSQSVSCEGDPASDIPKLQRRVCTGMSGRVERIAALLCGRPMAAYVVSAPDGSRCGDGTVGVVDSAGHGAAPVSGSAVSMAAVMPPPAADLVTEFVALSHHELSEVFERADINKTVLIKSLMPRQLFPSDDDESHRE